jgi:hypothetical protein
MSERRLQNAIYRFFRGKRHPVTIPNCGACGVGKADLLSVTKAQLVHEVEIKSSVADFQRDFEEKTYKHHALENQKGYRTANYFWFGVPDGLVEVEDVPAYAGLLYVTEAGGVDVMRRAPRIHGKKLRERDRAYIERGLTLRYWKTRLTGNNS